MLNGLGGEDDNEVLDEPIGIDNFDASNVYFQNNNISFD